MMHYPKDHPGYDDPGAQGGEDTRWIEAFEAMRAALRDVVICPAFNGQVFEKDRESHRAWTLARAALALAEGVSK